MVPDKNRPLLKSTTAKNITNTAKGGTIYNPSKDILNFADREIGNVAIKITNIETGQATYEDGKYHGDRTMTRYEMAETII